MSADLLTIRLVEAPLAFIDFEATGLRDFDEPVEVAIAHLDPGQLFPRLAFCSRVRPTVEMSRGATRVTGITDADLTSAPDWREVAPQVHAALAGRAVVAYNAPFDFRLLARQRLAEGFDPPTWPWLDAAVFVRSVDKYERDKSLHGTCLREGIALAPHGAAGDAIATALLWPRLLRRSSFGGSLSLADTLELQRDRALGQEREFCDYIRRTYGTRSPRPDCPWHELEGVALPEWPAPTRATGSCCLCGTLGVIYDVAQDGTVRALNTNGAPHECSEDIPF